MNTNPDCRFFRFALQGLPPSQADRFSSGTIPHRAAQYCDAVKVASGFGWWLFPPGDIYLNWDGQSIIWSPDGLEWSSVDDSVDFPGFPEAFDSKAPDDLRGTAPPFLTSLPEPGLIQVSLGLFARTAPGWSMLVRRPPNYPLSGQIEHFEGVIDTSHWFGPLFINLRLTKTDVPIRLHANKPLAQAQPLPHGLLESQMLAFETYDTLGPREWEAYRATTVEPNKRPNRPFGTYATSQRKERKARPSEGCRVDHQYAA